MNPLAIWKPEYVYRPRQLLRRLFRPTPRGEHVTVRLPWGLPIRVRPTEDVGRALLSLGVFDLAVTEVLWRLADRADVAVDVGANVGYMTSVLAARAGAVWSFEPHPVLFEELTANVRAWRASLPGTRLETVACAASSRAGSATLHVPADFVRRRGRSSLERGPGAWGEDVLVRVTTLDEALAGQRPTIVKVDVEGHEAAVLAGASRIVDTARDWVFEEHREYPTEVTRAFEARGLAVLRIVKRFRGVSAVRPDAEAPRSWWEPTSFIATRDPERVKARLAPPGWRSLG